MSDSIIIPWRRRDGAQRGELVGEEGAGVGVGEQADLVEHQPGHGGQVVDGGVVAVLGRATSAADRVALLGPLAEREQRLVAAGPGAGPGDGAAPGRASRYGDSRRAGGWANVQ